MKNLLARTRRATFEQAKVILQQEIEPTQIRKLLSEGRTELLAGFVSSRTHRKFKAYLSRGDDGKVSFEFEARKPKSGSDHTANDTKMPRNKTVTKKAQAKKSAAKKSARRVKKLKPAYKILGTGYGHNQECKFQNTEGEMEKVTTP